MLSRLLRSFLPLALAQAGGEGRLRCLLLMCPCWRGASFLGLGSSAHILYLCIPHLCIPFYHGPPPLHPPQSWSITSASSSIMVLHLFIPLDHDPSPLYPPLIVVLHLCILLHRCPPPLYLPPLNSPSLIPLDHHPPSLLLLLLHLSVLLGHGLHLSPWSFISVISLLHGSPSL